MATWHFCGDVNLEYGGTFIDLSTFTDGYCSAVRVTDLDSGCGFTGAVLIEHVVINGTTDRERVRAALRCCGFNFREWSDRTREQVRWAIADALCSYGCTDPDGAWDGYRGGASEVVQLEPDGPMKFDGWKADKRLHNTTLEAYVRSQHLDGPVHGEEEQLPNAMA
jgi:hypothetical protein